jgi:hypothetical protein
MDWPEDTTEEELFSDDVCQCPECQGDFARTHAGYVVKSGNDRHAVRERVRRLRGVIAYGWS